MMTNVARAIRGLSLGVWLGGGVMTFITAHYVFRGGFITSPTMSGDVMGQILHTGGLLKLGLAALALGTQWILRGDTASGPAARKTALITLAVAAVLVCLAVFYLEPTLVELRPQFRGDPPLENEARHTFAKLHGISMGLSLLELIAVALAMICVLI